MSTLNIAWTVLFLGLTAALLAWPFYPAWREWHHPLDALALALKKPASPHTDPSATQVRLVQGVATPPVVQASVRILANAGSQFQKLGAPTVLLGIAASSRQALAKAPPSSPWVPPPQAQPWGRHGWRIAGDCRIPDAHQVTGPLVVMGALTVGADCQLDGDIKAHGPVQVGPRSRLAGALFSEQPIRLQDDARVLGPVVSEVQIRLAPGVVVGTLEQPGTVSAPQLLAHAGAVVHGTVWASQSGQVV